MNTGSYAKFIHSHKNYSQMPKAVLQEELTQARILIVDDAPLNCEIIAGFLEAGGFSCFEYANNGIVALEKLDLFRPDILVLDLSMPKMDGFEVCRRIRDHDEWCDIPILIETGIDDANKRAEAFAVGATDLVTKPINQAELNARVRIHLEHRILMRDLQSYQSRIASELSLAREMQEALLPTDVVLFEINARHKVQIAQYFQPSEELGGDFWGVKETQKGQLAVYVVDFAGHGVNAAINTFRLHGLINEVWNLSDNPQLFLEALNERLVRLLSVEQYATMFYGIIDQEKQRICYAAAASTPPMVMVNKTGDVLMGDPRGIPLGVAPDTRYEMRELPFHPNNMLFLFSDGFIAVPYIEGEGPHSHVPNRAKNTTEEDIALLMSETPCPNAPIFLDRLVGTFNRWVDGKTEDDMSAVCISWPERSGQHVLSGINIIEELEAKEEERNT